MNWHPGAGGLIFVATPFTYSIVVNWQYGPTPLHFALPMFQQTIEAPSPVSIAHWLARVHAVASVSGVSGTSSVQHAAIARTSCSGVHGVF